MRFKALIQATAVIALTAGSSVDGSWAQSTDGPTQRVIVQWKQSVPKASATRILSDTGSRYGVSLTLVRTLAVGGDVIQLNRRLARNDLQGLVASLSKDQSVEYAHEDLLLKPAFTPNDPDYSEQWHYFEATAGLNLPQAWDLSTGAGVRIAVLDSGYRPHRDLVSNVVGGYDFISDTFISNDGDGRDASALDPGDFTPAGACGPGAPETMSSWHGTHVAGTLAAVTNNGAGVAGVAYGAKVVPVRVLGRCGGLLSDISDAAVWAAGGAVTGVTVKSNSAKVLNLSLGAVAPCNPTAQKTVNVVRNYGAVMVTAAGNNNSDAKSFLPANCEGVIAVAALARDGSRAYYSNFGTVIDVAAPGGDLRSSKANAVLSTLNTGTSTPGADTFAYDQGTSMATPHVAGVAALMFATNALTPDQVENILKSTARAFPRQCSQCGAGIVNALSAVNAAIIAPVIGPRQ